MEPIFTNLYHRVLLCNGITLEKVLEIKKEFVNYGLFVDDSKHNIHLYLSIKSKRFKKYIDKYIDKASSKIEISFKSLLLTNVSNLSKTQLKSKLLKEYYSGLSLENIIKLDFNSLFIILSNNNKISFSSNIDFLIEIQNLVLLESYLKSESSSSFNIDINKIEKKLKIFFDFNYYKNILLEINRIKK
ncbi:expressed protein [Dictyostelium purpureum]|uniref:Expressed protein n=1 Tax=Dictyostelium purpureum TaxID=5786 RepID=F0ZY40_DICPU|nr:uncharacterized protein DICPUDRAFT_95583 [Dictyostelium purpureum]EGC31140.1 expressed protein [Dictyostelium purpureum]|eukprot:XP_003292328.1 expressed protein [Dictyostelium purpureum]